MHQHQINSRIFSTVNSIEDELKLNPQLNYLFDLSYLGILDIQGTNSLDFLQGQFTCDLREVSDIQMIQGIQCDLKGRMLTSLDIILWKDYKLIVPQDLLKTTQKSLKMPAQLSRVSIEENTAFKIFGFYLQNPKDLSPHNTFFPTPLHAQAYQPQYCYYHLGNGFYVFLVEDSIIEPFCNAFKEQNQFLGSLTWHTLRLYQHQIDIYPESRGLFLPHRLGFHHTNYISFNKGCYKGQEIIARTHYRATIKHELKLYEIVWKHALYSGQKIFQPGGKIELGELVDYAPLSEGSYLIAVSILKEAPSHVSLEGFDEVLDLESST